MNDVEWRGEKGVPGFYKRMRIPNCGRSLPKRAQRSQRRPRDLLEFVTEFVCCRGARRDTVASIHKVGAEPARWGPQGSDQVRVMGYAEENCEAGRPSETWADRGDGSLGCAG